VFKNREEAAKKLAIELAKYKGTQTVVLGIPRGAVPMARMIADALHAAVDVVLVRKIGAPEQKELALGAVGEDGELYLNPWAVEKGFNPENLKSSIQEELEVIHKRRKYYCNGRTSLNLQDHTVIIVDDGIATGATAMAALKMIRRQKPKKLILATAVIPSGTMKQLQQFCDELVVLESSDHFFSVGQFFEDFRQVSDEEVRVLLNPADHGTQSAAF